MTEAFQQSYTYRSILDEAEKVVERFGYQDPEEAYCQCCVGVRKLADWLTPEFIAFPVGGRTKNRLLDNELFGVEDADLSEQAWHAACLVPTVGVVDVTGAQFGHDPVRIIEDMSAEWIEVDDIAPPRGLPIEEEDIGDLIERLPLPPEEVMSRLSAKYDAKSRFG